MAPVSFTVLGADGFIGRHLVRRLQADGVAVRACGRAELANEGLLETELGHVVYCIGLTADFRERPFDTVDAHVGVLAPLLQRARFDSLIYLSSTRVYAHSAAAHEDSPLTVRPGDPGDLYNLSKLAGESLCVASGRPTRVVRLSNVYGDDLDSENFISEILRQAAREQKVLLRSSPGSAKDFVSIDDVTSWLVPLAVHGRERFYNLARGENISNQALASRLQDLGVTVEFAGATVDSIFPRIDCARVSREFHPARHDLLEDLPSLLRSFSAAAHPARPNLPR